VPFLHAILDRNGLVKRRRRYKAEGTTLSRPHSPNDLWYADYKGEFMLADRRYCYPLTITDFASRYLLGCEALSTTNTMFAYCVFERAFKDFGLPRAIRTDNGITIRQCQLALWFDQAVRVVAATRHRPRAHQARTPRAERQPRTYASDLEEGSHQACRQKFPPAASEVRSVHPRLQ
jgi:putative transposase